jgi:hypothetical protein
MNILIFLGVIIPVLLAAAPTYAQTLPQRSCDANPNYIECPHDNHGLVPGKIFMIPANANVGDPTYADCDAAYAQDPGNTSSRCLDLLGENLAGAAAVGANVRPGANLTYANCLARYGQDYFHQQGQAVSICENASGPAPISGNMTSGVAQGQQLVNGQWHDLGHTPLGSVDTGVLRNEGGVFIPWNVICKQGRGLLLEPCGTLVDSNGILTPEGDRAVGCINNGLAYGLYALQHGISFGLAKTILGLGASLTGCGGIVDMNKIPNSPMWQFAVNSMGPR